MNYFLLALFNLLDGLFTHIGLSNEWIDEWNPLMKQAWERSPFWFLSIKALLSVFVVVIGKLKHRVRFSRLLDTIVTILAIVYGLVILVHVYWMAALFF